MLLPETYRFFLQNCQCKLIFLALCHDNGYMAELDKYRNDATAKQKTWLVDHYAKGRAFTDPPFPMIKFDEVFSSKSLPVKRVNGFGPIPKKSSYSSALPAPLRMEAASGIDKSPFTMPPSKSKYTSDAQSSISTPAGLQRNSLKELPPLHLASDVELRSSGDQIPVVCNPCARITKTALPPPSHTALTRLSL